MKCPKKLLYLLVSDAQSISAIKTFSPYRAVNTLRLGYTNQSVNIVEGNNRCLF